MNEGVNVINDLSNYAIAIVCSSFIMNLVQMILPNGSNKKYVLLVCGVITAIILISPVISLLNKDFNLKEVFEFNKESYEEIEKKKFEEYYSNEIIDTYKNNIKNGIVERLKKVGYQVKSINIEYDKVTMEPNNLIIEIESSDGTVQPVRVETIAIDGDESNNSKKNNISVLDKLKIESVLKNEYGFKKITINT